MFVHSLPAKLVLAAIAMFLLSACPAPINSGQPGLATADPAAAALNEGEPLHVVATTNIVADVVAQVGGEAIDLTALLPVGADPHSYTLAPQDVRTLNEAHVIFVNGLGLEEGMESTLENLDGDAAVVSVSQAVETIAFGEEGEEHEGEEHEGEEHEGEEHEGEAHEGEGHEGEAHEGEAHEGEEHEGEAHEGEEHEGEAHEGEEHTHKGADPHTWTSVHNVETWVATIVETLSVLDPASAETYAANGAAYLDQLAALEREIGDLIAPLPVERRKLVTDHDVFGYFANEHGFEIVGTVVPGLTTTAEPSAQDIAALTRQIEAEGVPAIFVGTTVSDQLARQIANDAGVQVVPLYTGSLSPLDGPAATYIDFMRYNVEAIVGALQP